MTQGGTPTTCVYDGDGGRVKKTVGTTTTTYIGKLYVCEGGGCAKLLYAGGQRIAIKQVSSGSISYFHPDHLGFTSVLTNGSGTKEEDLVDYPYGETYTNTGTANVAYKYTGKELDDSTGLYFYESRYYDAVLGRFISADTIIPSASNPQSFNRYSYANNNPIIFNDPSGHFAFKSIKKAFKKVENFSWKSRVYFSGGGSLVLDRALTNKTIGPYARIAFSVAASYFGGPLGAAGAQAYMTRLDGGSIGASLKSAGNAAGTSYIGGQVAGAFTSSAVSAGANMAAAQIAGAAVAGALNGAISSTLSGGDPSQGALYGAAYGAAFAAATLAAGEAYAYYNEKVIVATVQMRVDQPSTLVNCKGDYGCFNVGIQATLGPNGAEVTVLRSNGVPPNDLSVGIYSSAKDPGWLQFRGVNDRFNGLTPHGSVSVPPNGSARLIIPYGDLSGDHITGWLPVWNDSFGNPNEGQVTIYTCLGSCRSDL